ncbi:MAG: hypothetical protein FWE36_03505 [Erysipelotrichales bacterium]|nr:hypothetical protein [Erysipelotrichales bacterium]
MNKKNVIISLIVILFCAIALSACSSNSGRIRGSEGARYSARFYGRTPRIFAENDVMLISCLDELAEWKKNALEEYEKLLPSLVDPIYFEEYLKAFEEMLSEKLYGFSSDFFVGNQVIILPNLSSGTFEQFAVRNINYYNGNLSIELRIIRSFRASDSLGIRQFGIIEITKISADLNIDLSIT